MGRKLVSIYIVYLYTALLVWVKSSVRYTIRPPEREFEGEEVANLELWKVGEMVSLQKYCIL